MSVCNVLKTEPYARYHARSAGPTDVVAVVGGIVAAGTIGFVDVGASGRWVTWVTRVADCPEGTLVLRGLATAGAITAGVVATGSA
jgi:hypothetical protein